jgi:hypothetical protein
VTTSYVTADHRCRVVIPGPCGNFDATTLTISLPAILEQKMQPRNAKMHFSVGDFAAEEVTLGQAAMIAGISQTEFMRE